MGLLQTEAELVFGGLLSWLIRQVVWTHRPRVAGPGDPVPCPENVTHGQAGKLIRTFAQRLFHRAVELIFQPQPTTAPFADEQLEFDFLNLLSEPAA
jgi:hypothetical protein